MAENKDRSSTATAERSDEPRTTASKDEAPRDPRAAGVPTPQVVVREEGGATGDFDVVGGNIAETVNQPLDAAQRDRTRAARLMMRAAKAVGGWPAGLSAMIGRPADEWGLVGQGDTVTGHFVLIDLDSLEKVEVTERWQIDQDRVFANAQQWPKALVHGETLAEIAGGRKRDTEAREAAEAEEAETRRAEARSR